LGYDAAVVQLSRETARPSPSAEPAALPARGSAARLSVIVPTFNERDNVEALLLGLEAVLPSRGWEVIFVDDDSPDGTAELVRSLARARPHVRCIQRLGRRGLSSAVIEGFLASSSPCLAVIDGDLQHDERLLPAMLELLERRLKSAKLTNVTPILGSIDDPKLPPASIDMALMVDVYHELSRPQEMLRHIREALKPGGRLVLLEYRKEDPSIPIRPEHKMSVAEAKRELEAEGFKLARVADELPRQHVLIFTKR